MELMQAREVKETAHLECQACCFAGFLGFISCALQNKQVTEHSEV